MERANSQARLLDKLCSDIKPGVVDWIGLRSERKGLVHSVASCEAIEGLGLQGDHRVLKSPGSARQVTIISREFILAVQHQMGMDFIDPAWLRRNILISGMNLNILRYQRLQIGNVILETSALAHPCSRMDEALGKGGAAAMFGYGGLCAKVIQGGKIAVGDFVVRLPAER